MDEDVSQELSYLVNFCALAKESANLFLFQIPFFFFFFEASCNALRCCAKAPRCSLLSLIIKGSHSWLLLKELKGHKGPRSQHSHLQKLKASSHPNILWQMSRHAVCWGSIQPYKGNIFDCSYPHANH